MDTAEKLKVALAVAEALDDRETTEVGTPSTPSLRIPDTVIIRTVTHYYVDRVTGRDDTFIELDEASWVASTGRWSDALTSGSLDEVEPFPSRVLVAIGSIVDVAEWSHKLPRTQR